MRANTLMFLAAVARLASADCPPKISAKACPAFESASDTAYLDIRIVLDLAQEGEVTSKAEKRPLRLWTEDLQAKYDLRRLYQPESAYVPTYNEGDNIPSVDQVQFHNVSVTKSDMRGIATEWYVASLEPGCRKMSNTLCSEANLRNDSALVFFRFTFGFESDSAEFEAFLARHEVLSVLDSTRVRNASGFQRIDKCVVSGYLSAPETLRAMGRDLDLESGILETGSLVCSMGLRAIPGKIHRPSLGISPLWGEYRPDGRRNAASGRRGKPRR